jgi:uncharacterized protein (DUF362 family)
MKMLARKKFLAIISASAFGLFLAGCFSRTSSIDFISKNPASSGTARQEAKATQSVNTSKETVQSSDTSKKSTEESSKTSATASGKKIMVGIAGSNSSIEYLVAKAVELAGGLGFIKNGSTVMLKPNFNTGNQNPASANPEVIRQVIRLVKKQNPLQVIVADRSGFWLDTEKCMAQNGVTDVANEEGAELVALEDEEWEKISPKLALNWPNGFRVPKLLNEADYVISIPVLKTHSIANFSMSIKNWVGILYAKDRVSDLHLFNGKEETFGYKLAELHLARVPDFIIMDGSKAFVEGGPTEGKIVDSNLVIASNDIIANDITGLAVLKNLGTIRKIQDRSVWEQPQIIRAVQLGLGIKSSSGFELNPEGIDYINNIAAEIKGN